MKNRKNKLIFFSIIFSLFVFNSFVFTGGESRVFAADTTVSTAQTNVSSPSQETQKPDTIPEKNAYQLTHMKDVQKTGFKYKIFKFFTAMFGVLVSIIAIFFGLKLYKKFVLKNNLNLDNINYDETLESPKDFKEAINLFLDKTDKE